MQIYMQWSSDNSYTSSNQKLIIECLPHFEKLALSQFKVYIEVEKMTHCYECNNCQMSIFIQSSNVKEGFFCILQMLRIHTGLRKWNKNNGYNLHIHDNRINLNMHKMCSEIYMLIQHQKLCF